MKNLMSMSFIRVVLVISLFVSLVSSCKKDDDVNPDYLGTWSAIETSEMDGFSKQTKEVLTFTENQFSYLTQESDSSGMFIDVLKLRGNLSVANATMNLNITEIDFPSYDPDSGQPTGELDSYKEGSDEFNSLVTLMGFPQTLQFEYSLSGNKLTIKTDNNDDGDNTDPGETIVYTKE